MPYESAADKLTIETPEQTSLDFAVAGIGSRFLAILIDVLIQSAIGFIAGILRILLMGAMSLVGPKASLWVGAFFVLFYFVLYFRLLRDLRNYLEWADAGKT